MLPSERTVLPFCGMAKYVRGGFGILKVPLHTEDKARPFRAPAHLSFAMSRAVRATQSSYVDLSCLRPHWTTQSAHVSSLLAPAEVTLQSLNGLCLCTAARRCPGLVSCFFVSREHLRKRVYQKIPDFDLLHDASASLHGPTLGPAPHVEDPAAAKSPGGAVSTSSRRQRRQSRSHRRQLDKRHAATAASFLR